MHANYAWKESDLNYIEQIFKIMNTFFWIHGNGLPKKYASKRKSKFSMFTIIGLIYEVSSSFKLYLPFRNSKLPKISVNGFIHWFSEFLLKCAFFAKRKTLLQLVHRLAKVYPRAQSEKLKKIKKLKRILIVVILIFEVLIAVLIILFILADRMCGNLHPILNYYLTIVLFMKATPYCIILYFFFASFSVAEIFQVLQAILPSGLLSTKKLLTSLKKPMRRCPIFYSSFQ